MDKIKEIKEMLFMAELMIIEAQQDTESPYKSDKLAKSRVHVEIAARQLMHVLYPETDMQFEEGQDYLIGEMDK